MKEERKERLNCGIPLHWFAKQKQQNATIFQILSLCGIAEWKDQTTPLFSHCLVQLERNQNKSLPYFEKHSYANYKGVPKDRFYKGFFDYS